MNKIKKLILAMVVGTFSFGTVGCAMIEKTPEAINKSVVAKVNADTITRGKLDTNPIIAQQINSLKEKFGKDFSKNEQVREQFKEMKKQVLENMITEKIIKQKLKELKIDENEINKETDKELANIKKQGFGNDPKKYEESLKKMGVTEQQLKDFYKSKVTVKIVGEKIAKDVKVDDKTAKKYFDENIYQFCEKPSKFHALHILVKTEDEAKKVKERLNKGEDFGKIAKEVSQDPGSKDKGGDLGNSEYSRMIKSFSDAIVKMKKGEISSPVKTMYGYHIIKLINKEPVSIKKFDSVKEQIKKDLLPKEQEKAFSDKISKWRKDSKIETKKYEKNII